MQDITEAIQAATPRATAQATKFAHLLQGQSQAQTLHNIWQVLRSLNYQPDGFAHQKIKLPSALMHTKTGDCKSYALFTAAVCNVLGIPCKYVVTTYGKANEAHIYCISGNTVIDGTLSQYNYEAPNHTTKNTYSTMTKVSVMGNASTGFVGDRLAREAVKTAMNQLTKAMGSGIEKFSQNDSAVKLVRNLSTKGLPAARQQVKTVFRFIRFIILLAFRENVKGIATGFSKSMNEKQRYPIYRLFYALGGNTQMALWPAVNAGAKKPATQVNSIADWALKITNAFSKANANELKGNVKAAWNLSRIGLAGLSETAGGLTAGQTLLASIAASIAAYVAADPERAIDKAVEITKDLGGGRNNLPPIPDGGQANANTNNSSILPLAALAALALG